MVVILDNQLFHLGEGIVPSLWHVHSDIRNLCPHNQAVFVAEIKEFLSMLVMGQAQGSGADFPNYFHILLVMF